MFDISARRNLTVNTLEINFQEILIDMDYFVSVWTKPDTYLGFESNASAWENIFIARVRVPLSTENTTLLPPERFNPRDVAQGSSQSFYIAVQSTNEMPISSSKGLQPGSVAIMNKDLMIHQGVAHQSIFPTVSSVSGVISLARLNYSVCEANYTEEAALCPGSDDWSLSTRMDGETVTNGIFFDAVARSNVTVVGLDMRLKKRSSDKDIIVTVWTKEGTHEGFEGNVSAWTPIFSSSVTYGLDGLVSLPESLFDFVDIVEGSSQGFYMAVRDTDELVMMVSSGSNVGAPFATSCAIQINTGKQADASFEASETASLNGVFRYMACPSNIDCNDTLPPDSIISYDCPNEEERNLNTSASALAMDGHTLVKISESTRDLKSGGICYLGENNSMSGCSRYIFKEACAFAGLRIESQGDPKVTYVINNDLVINCSRTRTEEQCCQDGNCLSTEAFGGSTVFLKVVNASDDLAFLPGLKGSGSLCSACLDNQSSQILSSPSTLANALDDCYFGLGWYNIESDVGDDCEPIAVPKGTDSAASVISWLLPLVYVVVPMHTIGMNL